MAIAQLITCDTIRMLPGSENSKGAILELHIAMSLGMTVEDAR
uniref:MazG-like protein n=3 Tax=unclassified bacterial viruses TaxID=12333 RepID=A0AAU6W301_9VIRU